MSGEKRRGERGEDDEGDDEEARVCRRVDAMRKRDGPARNASREPFWKPYA